LKFGLLLSVSIALNSHVLVSIRFINMMTTKTLVYIVSVYTYADKSYAAAYMHISAFTSQTVFLLHMVYKCIHPIYFHKHETLTQE